MRLIKPGISNVGPGLSDPEWDWFWRDIVISMPFNEHSENSTFNQIQAPISGWPYQEKFNIATSGIRWGIEDYGLCMECGSIQSARAYLASEDDVRFDISPDDGLTLFCYQTLQQENRFFVSKAADTSYDYGVYVTSTSMIVFYGANQNMNFSNLSPDYSFGHDSFNTFAISISPEESVAVLKNSNGTNSQTLSGVSLVNNSKRLVFGGRWTGLGESFDFATGTKIAFFAQKNRRTSLEMLEKWVEDPFGPLIIADPIPQIFGGVPVAPSFNFPVFSKDAIHQTSGRVVR